MIFSSKYIFVCTTKILPLEMQLLKGQGQDAINWFNPATFLCLSQARIYGFQPADVMFFLVFNYLRFVCFIDFDGIVDIHCLNFLFLLFMYGKHHYSKFSTPWVSALQKQDLICSLQGQKSFDNVQPQIVHNSNTQICHRMGRISECPHV